MSYTDKELAHQTLVNYYALQDKTNADLLNAQANLERVRVSGDDAKIVAAQDIFSRTMMNSSKLMSLIFKAQKAYNEFATATVVAAVPAAAVPAAATVVAAVPAAAAK